MRSIWTTKNGYWKTTFEEEEVLGHNIIVGFKKIWRFFWGQEPNGKISDWIIKEYRLNPSLIPADELNNRIIKKETNTQRFKSFSNFDADSVKDSLIFSSQSYGTGRRRQCVLFAQVPIYVADRGFLEF
ncbi:isoform 2 of nac domain-containing protein 79 [Fagus crenata]